MIDPKITQEWMKKMGLASGECDRLEMASQRRNESIFKIVLEEKLLPEEDVMDFIGDQLGIPTLNLQAMQFEDEILKIFPRKFVEQHHIFPVGRIGKLMTVATSDPFKMRTLDEIKNMTGCGANLVLVVPSRITAAIEDHYAENRNFAEFLAEKDAPSLEVEGWNEGGVPSRVQVVTDNAPVIKMVNFILEKALKSRASDIHFEPYEKEFRIRYRVDGALKESFSHSLDLYPALVARTKIISLLDITERRLPQDGRFRLSLKDRQIDFRVSVLPTYFGEKIVLRVLDRSGIKAGLDKLGFTEKPTRALAEAIKKPYGLILVTGRRAVENPRPFTRSLIRSTRRKKI